MPANAVAVLESIPRVDNSPRAECWQQRQIAAQNTALDQALGKSKKVYKAPCDLGIKPDAAPPKTSDTGAEPKTS